MDGARAMLRNSSTYCKKNNKKQQTRATGAASRGSKGRPSDKNGRECHKESNHRGRARPTIDPRC
eukprot:1671394-Pleurochrysis_carterae.AAC.2